MKVSVRSLLSLTVVLFSLAIVTVDAQASTYYVAVNGSNASSGTVTAPWLTLRHAVAQLRAGDTLYLRGGTYTGSANTIDAVLGTVPSGSSWTNAITIAGYTAEVVTIRPPDGQTGIKLSSGIHLGAAGIKYLIFQDLIVDGANQTRDAGHGGVDGVYLNGGANHIRLLRIEVKNWLGFGVATSAHNDVAPWSTYHEVINCKLHDNGLGLGTPTAPYAPNTGYGVYLNTSDNLYEGNEVYNNGGYGLHVVDDGVPGERHVSRNVIRNNKVYGNGVRGGTSYGIVVGYGDRNQVYNNLVYRNGGGILVYTNSTNTAVYNNTIFDNKPSEGILTQYSTTVTIKNNIVYSNAATIVDLNGNSTIANNIMIDPRFVDAASGNFYLGSNSPAINAGVTLVEVPNDFAGVSRPQGGGYDVGAYEYVSGSPSPPSNPKNLRWAPGP